MINLSKHRVLIAGILSGPAAAILGIATYSTMTRASADRNADFVSRLGTVTLVMILPFAITLALAIWQRRRAPLPRSGRVGVAIAMLSLTLTWLPLRGLIGRIQQSRNLAMQNVAAPQFDTTDVFGQTHRLRDHLGKVVLINAWATWCPPCRKEMPELDDLYRRRKDEGLWVVGLSTESAELQRKFLEETVRVTYPLLTVNGDVPSLYRDIQKWPAVFLVDRQGRLQPAPEAGQGIDTIEAAVEVLLKQAAH